MKITLVGLARAADFLFGVRRIGHAGPAEKTRLTLACNISNGSQKRMWSIPNEFGTVLVTPPGVTALSKRTMRKPRNSETPNPRGI